MGSRIKNLKEWLKQNWFQLGVLIVFIWTAVHLNNFLDKAARWSNERWDQNVYWHDGDKIPGLPKLP